MSVRELERLESERVGLFILTGGLGAAVTFALARDLRAACLLGGVVGLWGSGCFVAWRMTSAYIWAFVIAEARQGSGRLPSKRGVWIGNQVLPVAALPLAAWLLSR